LRAIIEGTMMRQPIYEDLCTLLDVMLAEHHLDRLPNEQMQVPAEDMMGGVEGYAPEVRFARDSPLEGTGFEPSVPPERCVRHINPPHSKRERSSAKTNGKNGWSRPRKGWS
jgi:hypothetical protein